MALENSRSDRPHPASGGLEDAPVTEAALRRRVARKLDARVLPALAFLWLANFIDRSNIGNAKVAGLSADLHLKGTEFNSALAVFYASYIVSELPSNLILKRVGANIWLPVIVVAWGTVTTLFGLVQTYGGLIAVRVVLGFCEGGLLPGMVLYLSTLYTRHELQIRIGIFYASSSLSGAFGGLLAYGILQMGTRAGLHAWRYIFILEGIATVLIGLAAMIVLPKSLATAKFLTEEEREYAIARFNKDSRARIATTAFHTAGVAPGEKPMGKPGSVSSSEEWRSESEKDEGALEQAEVHPAPERHAGAKEEEYDPYRVAEPFDWKEVRRGIFDPQTWLTGLAYMAVCISLYSYSLFLPSILSALGYTGEQTQIYTVPPYVPAAVVTVVIAFAADRARMRGPFILALLPIAAAGYILAICATTNKGRYAAVFLMALGIYPSVPCILSILPNNHSGHWKRASSTAFQLMIANCAGFIATFSYTSDQVKTHYRKGHSIVLAFVCFAWVLILANVLLCRWENTKRHRGERDGDVAAWEARPNKREGEIIGDRDPTYRLTL